MGDVRVTFSRALAADKDGSKVRITSERTLALFKIPSEFLRVTSNRNLVVDRVATDVRVTSVRTLALVKGRVDNRRVRAWTFSLDGHDFYLLRLGESKTIVCDLATGQWMEWNNGGETFFTPVHGMNWLGMGATTFSRYGHKNNIVAGDDTFSILWLMDPEGSLDDNSRTGIPEAFTRVVTGGLPMKNRFTQKVSAAYLTVARGNPALTGSSFTLRTSDDNGKSWATHDTITTSVGEYDKEVVWRSIGLLQAPGRIFEISDDGGTQRINGMDMR